MKTIDELTDEIVNGFELGDNLYGEVAAVVKGKLLDRHDKLVGKKTRKGVIITQDRICNTVSNAVSRMMSNALSMKETSFYYNLKYERELNG